MTDTSSKPDRPYDLFSQQFKRDPFPTFAQMRQESPVYPHEAPDGSIIWYISRYDDCVAVLLDDENFCKDPRNALPKSNTPAPRKSAMHQSINENMLFSDPPDHTRLRSLVNKAFTPRRVAKNAGYIQQTADTLLDRQAQKGEIELISQYALPLSVFVISELLGIPAMDREKVADWSQAIISPGSRNLNYSARKRKVRALTGYLQTMFEERRNSPRDDLVSDLVQVKVEGDSLNEAELSSMIALLLVTGHETTVNLIGNGTLTLLQNREQLTQLTKDPALWNSAIEEILRYDGPVETSTSRWARQDVEFAGNLMKRGDMVRVIIASANRDRNKFEDPTKLILDRKDNHHLAFGLGIHYCLGAPLARLEGIIALSTLFNRLPNLHLTNSANDLDWRSGVLFRGIKALPLSWDHTSAGQ